MFFKLANVDSKKLPLSIVIRHGGEEMEFTINVIVNKKKKDELEPTRQFELINAYLDYKGDEFKSRLFSAYHESKDALFDRIRSIGGDDDDDLTSIRAKMLNPIYALIDIEDVYKYLVGVYKLKPIQSLSDEYDDKVLRDGIWSREQTYTKDDYMWLASLVVVLKATLGPIGEYACFDQANINKVLLHYTMFNFYRGTEIYKTDPFQKLVGLAEKVSANILKNDTDRKFTAMDMKIPEDELPIWALSAAIFQKVAVSAIVDDNADKHVITKLYSFIKNKFNKTGDKSGNYADKKNKRLTPSGDDESTESIIESYRVVGDVTPGFQVEMTWAIDLIFESPWRLSDTIDKELVDEIYELLVTTEGKQVHEEQVTMLGWVLGAEIHPKSLIYVDIDSIFKALAVGYAYLYKLGYGYLAMMLTSSKIDHDDVVVVNFTTNRTRITNELKHELDRIFPYKMVTAATIAADSKEVNMAETAINHVANMFYRSQWLRIAPKRHVKELAGDANLTFSPDPGLKVMMANMLITLKNRALPHQTVYESLVGN